jgi:hypothetical protein
LGTVKPASALSEIGVDLALVFAVDVSSSVDAGDFKLQMDGIAAALRKPLTLQYVQSGPNQKIAISMVQWSSVRKQVVTLDWQVLADSAGIEAAAVKIETGPRQWSPGGTGLAAALVFCAGLLKAFPIPARRKLIDMSGDGSDNENGDVALARAAALASGITINGLPILDGSDLIQAYYRDQVIGGPGAFIEPAANTMAFGAAMERKLLRELQDLSS